MSEEIYGDIFGENDLTSEQILKTLLVADEDIDMKTEIYTPLEIAGLEAFIPLLIENNLKPLGIYIKDILYGFKKLMVSFRRKSRDETTRVLTARMEDKYTTRDLTKKLMGSN